MKTRDVPMSTFLEIVILWNKLRKINRLKKEIK